MLKENGGIRYISSSIFPDSVARGFLTRAGGVSSPPFDSLNFDYRGADQAADIDENMRIVSGALNVALENLVTVNQVHGDGILTVTHRDQIREKPDADAIITSLTEVPVGILTADCLPILLFDKGGAIGAVHAGWRGTAKGIVIKAVEAMGRTYGTRAEDILCALGPYIGPCCYTVGEDVASGFRSSFGDTKGFIEERSNGRISLDIGLSNLSQLISAGVSKENISFDPACTSCNNRLFFSYRKDGGRTGRQLSFIMLRAQPKG